MSPTLTPIERAKLMHDRFDLECELRKLNKENNKRTTDLQLSIYTNFEKLCINLARADGNISYLDIKKLSWQEFYFLKQNVDDMAERRNSKNKTED